MVIVASWSLFSAEKLETAPSGAWIAHRQAQRFPARNPETPSDTLEKFQAGNVNKS